MGVIFNVKTRLMHYIYIYIYIYICVCEHHYIDTIALPHVSALKGPTSGSTETFCEKRQEYT